MGFTERFDAFVKAYLMLIDDQDAAALDFHKLNDVDLATKLMRLKPIRCNLVAGTIIYANGQYCRLKQDLWVHIRSITYDFAIVEVKSLPYVFTVKPRSMSSVKTAEEIGI